MELKKLCISAVGASMLIATSIASAETVTCYKNPGNNNGHRYVVSYSQQYNRAHIQNRVLQVWDGRGYVDKKREGGKRVLSWTPNKAYVCKNLYGYKYYH